MNRVAKVLLAGAAISAASLLGVTGAAASAPAQAKRTTCSGTGWANPGVLKSGTYHGVIVSGLCMVQAGAHVVVRGNVTMQKAGTLFAIKDNHFYGSVTLDSWSGCWMGFIRNSVHGTVTITNNYANPSNYINGNPPEPQGLDSTEVVANHIRGSLHCSDNTPAAQFGDATTGAPASYGPNVVTGRATGECRALVATD